MITHVKIVQIDVCQDCSTSAFYLWDLSLGCIMKNVDFFRYRDTHMCPTVTRFMKHRHTNYSFAGIVSDLHLTYTRVSSEQDMCGSHPLMQLWHFWVKVALWWGHLHYTWESGHHTDGIPPAEGLGWRCAGTYHTWASWMCGNKWVF